MFKYLLVIETEHSVTGVLCLLYILNYAGGEGRWWNNKDLPVES